MSASPYPQALVDELAMGRFDQDYIDDALLDRLVEAVAAVRPEVARIADFGGGNGRFLDRLLSRMPRAHGTNYEISAHLRSLNAAPPRKELVATSFLSLDRHSQYDLVLMNWVLHHLVGKDLPATKQLIADAAAVAYDVLKPGGVLVVSENLLQSSFRAGISSAALFMVTRSRLLRPIVSRMRDGKAVAGVGIYYMSETELGSVLARFEPVTNFDRGAHDYGWKLRPIGITCVREKVLVFRKPGG